LKNFNDPYGLVSDVRLRNFRNDVKQRLNVPAVVLHGSIETAS